MKYLLIILLSSCSAIAQITDDFSDGNFTQNPIWIGDESHFEIDTLNQLHLNAPSQTANSILCFKSSLLENTLWEISLKMDFNPSSSNYLEWYILANDSLLDASNAAYFLRIGGTEDKIILYKKEGEETIELISSSNGIINTNPVEIRLKVERKIGGIFSVWIDLENDTTWTLLK